jgi:hypothetical protein
MIRIVVGGQIDKEALAALIRTVGGDKVQVTVKSDIEAAMAIKTGQADYYFGACHTGGGGALAMAIALLGMGTCATVSMPGKVRTDEEILTEIKNGKKAFGFTPQHMEQVVKLIISQLLK